MIRTLIWACEIRLLRQTCELVYERGDHAIKCTFLAHFPNGGFQGFDDNKFDLADEPPSGVEELQALMANPSLPDRPSRIALNRRRSILQN